MATNRKRINSAMATAEKGTLSRSRKAAYNKSIVVNRKADSTLTNAKLHRAAMKAAGSRTAGRVGG